MIQPSSQNLPGLLALAAALLVVSAGGCGCQGDDADEVSRRTTGSTVKPTDVGSRRPASPSRPLLKVARDDGSGDFEMLEI